MDQDRPPPRRASNRSCVAHRRADLPETGLRSSQRVLARTTDVSASSLPEATLPTMQASLQSTLHAPTIFESWLPMDSDIFRKGNCNAKISQQTIMNATKAPIMGRIAPTKIAGQLGTAFCQQMIDRRGLAQLLQVRSGPPATTDFPVGTGLC